MMPFLERALRLGAGAGSTSAEPDPGDAMNGSDSASEREAGAGPGPRPAHPSHDQIMERAFSIHEREGGDPDENWLRAERELLEHAREAAKREPDPPAPGES